VIAVPHYLHEPIALNALASGNHLVLRKKPLAPTLDSCQAREEIALAKTCIQCGEIGTILSAASYFYESKRCNLTSGMDENNGGLGW
jgi:hypothetical protein